MHWVSHTVHASDTGWYLHWTVVTLDGSYVVSPCGVSAMLGVFRFAACDFAMNSCVSKHLCRLVSSLKPPIQSQTRGVKRTIFE